MGSGARFSGLSSPSASSLSSPPSPAVVPEMVLYCSAQGGWEVCPASERGRAGGYQHAMAGAGVVAGMASGSGWAHVACEADARPEQCTGAWRVGGEEQASVRASAVGVSVGRGFHLVKCLSLVDHACLLACSLARLLACSLACLLALLVVCLCWCVLSGRETLVARGAGEGAGGGGGGAGGERGQGHRQGQGESSAPTVVPQVLGVLSLTFVEFGVQFDE